MVRALTYVDDCSLPTTSFETEKVVHRPSHHHHRSSSCCGVPISPYLRIDRLFRRSFSYDNILHQFLKLTIRKLDGSTFDIDVAEAARVADLKKAVEEVFSNVAREGSSEISWSHVWGHFCLSYDDSKLLDDNQPISNYGIKDGDELHFVRQVSVNNNLTRRRSGDKLLTDLPRMSCDQLEKEHGGKECGSEDVEGSTQHYDMSFGQLLSWWFSYSRVRNPGNTSESGYIPARLSDGIFGGFRSSLQLFRNDDDRLDSETDPMDMV